MAQYLDVAQVADLMGNAYKMQTPWDRVHLTDAEAVAFALGDDRCVRCGGYKNWGLMDHGWALCVNCIEPHISDPVQQASVAWANGDVEATTRAMIAAHRVAGA